MTSLHEELTEKSVSTRCITCRYLSTLSAKDRAEWDAELRIASITNEAIANALRKRGVAIGPFAVRNHRHNHLT